MAEVLCEQNLMEAIFTVCEGNCDLYMYMI